MKRRINTYITSHRLVLAAALTFALVQLPESHAQPLSQAFRVKQTSAQWMGGFGQLTAGYTMTGAGTAMGVGDGMFKGYVLDIAFDSSGNLYAVDADGWRIQRFTSAGVPNGWIGKVNAIPTGGAAGCTTVGPGGVTPGFCTGGNAWFGFGSGELEIPQAIAFDSSGNFYVADRPGKIDKYNSSGVFQGWIGKIGTSPTGGAAGCNGAGAGTFTPGWCTGGTAAQSSASDGSANYHVGLAVDGSGNIYATDLNNARILKYNSAGVFQGWRGKVGTTPTGGAAGCTATGVGGTTPGWCTGGASAVGQDDGQFATPIGITFDVSGNMYVVDYAWGRVQKWNSAGTFIGWIGKIFASPTGGAAGCNGAAVNSFTPGWCTGGNAYGGNNTNGTMNTPKGIKFDAAGANFYVADGGNARVNKYTSAGVFVGWSGQIGTSPTGGSAGCNGATVGTITPGWCTGGASAAGTIDGAFNSPAGIALDSSGNLYVADSGTHRLTKHSSGGVFQGGVSATTVFSPLTTTTNLVPAAGTGNGALQNPRGVTVDSTLQIFVADAANHRISKYSSTGTFLGWIGRVLTSPTGGAAGCNGRGVGLATPGFCTGGTAQSGTGDGMLNNPYGVTLDNSGNILVAEAGTGRISKFNSAGVFQGWIGKIATAPTGGAAGCAGLGAGNQTPGFCTGGTSANGTGNGNLNTPFAIAFDPTYANFYVADSANGRINKYTAAGVFSGWIGKIGTSPTGGAAGCNGAGVGTITPGWCTGGTGAAGNASGALDQPSGLAVDTAGNLYVADYNNGRISKYNSAGVFQGWIGAIGTSPTGGAAGCNGATVGTFTPGWCTGGTATMASGDGMLNYARSVTVDRLDNLYVTDGSNSRISKYHPSGKFIGWIGGTNNTITGGDRGCTRTAIGGVAPGWCRGGAGRAGVNLGFSNFPAGVAVDVKGNVYTTDYYNAVITKYLFGR